MFSRDRKDEALKCLFQMSCIFMSTFPGVEFHTFLFSFGCLLRGLAILFAPAGCWKHHPFHEAFQPPQPGLGSRPVSCPHNLPLKPSETFALSNHYVAFVSYGVAFISVSLQWLAQCLSQSSIWNIPVDFLNYDLNK